MQERNSCPVCGSFDLEFKCSYTSKESADIFCPPFRNEDRNKRLISAIENLWNQDHCKVYQCKDCTFGFAIPFIGGNEEYYEILHEQMGYPSWRWEYDAAISSLTSKKSARILDIGAGEGNFLSKFPEDYDLNAIESSDLTINELSKKGISGYKSIEDKKEEWRDSFDCVTLFQVLEHISEFKDIIEDAKYILKTGGKFIVSVPNADDMFEQERILNHPDMPPNHINKWSVKSLSIALKNSGFKVIHHMHEKRSLRNIKTKVHLRLLANANRVNRVESKIYSINKKPLRVILLALIFPFVLLELLPHLDYLTKGGAIYLEAKKYNP